VAEDKKTRGFVSLKSITAGKPDPAAALAEIRQIYFKTTKRTIDNDLAHAIDLVKSLPDEETRSKAHVYMEGLAEMAREWQRGSGKVEKSRSGKVRREERNRRKP
jgi:TPR repeat protein